MDEKDKGKNSTQKHDLNFYAELLEKIKKLPKEEEARYLTDVPMFSTPNKQMRDKPKEN